MTLAQVLAEQVGDTTLYFVLALAALIVACVVFVMSRPAWNILAIGVGLVSLALVLNWWP